MWMESFEIGGQRLMDKFHKHDPITSAEISELENYLDEKLGLLHEACRVFNPDTLIGSSGTFDTLSDMYRIEEGLERDPESAELPLSIQRYHLTHQQLITKTRSERLAIPGMIEMRVDMIVVASVLISYVLKRCNIHHFRGSAYALKEGVLLNILETVRQIDGAEKKKSNPNN